MLHPSANCQSSGSREKQQSRLLLPNHSRRVSPFYQHLLARRVRISLLDFSNDIWSKILNPPQRDIILIPTTFLPLSASTTRFFHVPHHHIHFFSAIITINFFPFLLNTSQDDSKMAGGKGKSSGGKSSGGKTSAAEGPKKQQSHSARAGLQVRSHYIVIVTIAIRQQLRSRSRCLRTATPFDAFRNTRPFRRSSSFSSLAFVHLHARKKHVDFAL